MFTANVSSKLELREVLKYEHKRMEKGWFIAYQIQYISTVCIP